MIAGQTVIAWIVSALIMSGAWMKVFGDAEKHVAARTKTRIRRWFVPLKDDDEAEDSNWAEHFIEIFDSIFGTVFSDTDLFSVRLQRRRYFLCLYFAYLLVLKLLPWKAMNTS